MTFSRKYAKARKAGQPDGRKPASTPASYSSQARRLTESTVQVRDRRGASRWLISLLIAVVVFGAGTGLWLFRHEFIVPIRHVNVEGAINQVDPRVLQVTLDSVIDKSMFSNLQPLQQQLSAVPWIKSVSLKRVWPNTLVVNLTEVEPVARFNNDLVLTRNGAVFTPPSFSHLMTLPLLIGPADKALFLWQGYCVMSDLLNPAGLKIWQLALSPRFSYVVVLNNGLILLLGTTQVTERLQLFLKIYGQQIAPKMSQIAYVDLRYPSSLAIGWKTPAPSL